MCDPIYLKRNRVGKSDMVTQTGWVLVRGREQEEWLLTDMGSLGLALAPGQPAPC